MYKLDLEKAEESEIKLPISVGSQKAREFHKSIYFCFIDYAKAFDYVDHNKLWEIILPVSWETSMWVKKQQWEPDMEWWTG